jgi:hypothetical protein
MSETVNIKAAKTSRPTGLNQKDSTLFWVGISLVLHVILMVATSVGFINDTWIDPEGAAQRKAAEAAAQKAAAAPATQPAPVATAPAAGKTAGPAVGSTPAASTGATNDKPKSEADLVNERKDAPVVKKATEVTKPSEIPSAPDLGFGLDDVNTPAPSKKK